MNFRIACEIDTIALAELRWDFCLEDSQSSPLFSREEFIVLCSEVLRGNLDQQNWVYWVAELDGKIISHIFVQLIDMIPKPTRLRDRYGYVTNTYTQPIYRKQGIGTKLMHHVKQWAKTEDLELLIVWPSQVSVAFYERVGFSRNNGVLECSIRD
jgi:GNAT superfamily N-acetyltransferase